MTAWELASLRACGLARFPSSGIWKIFHSF